MNTLRLENVGRIFTWDWAVRGICARWNSGETVGVVGANGSGKSTLIRMISGCLRPTCGNIRLDGRRVRRGAVGVNARMMLLEPDQRIVGGGILTHFATAMASYGATNQETIDAVASWLQHFELDGPAERQSVEFSRGQRMKVWLATLFALRPTIWLLDEPHQSGLDAYGIDTLESEIEKHRLSGGLVVFTTQYPPHARQLASRVMVLDHGTVTFDGPLSELSDSPTADSAGLGAILRGLEGVGQ